MVIQRLIFPLPLLQAAVREATSAMVSIIDFPLGVAQSATADEYLVAPRGTPDLPYQLRLVLTDNLRPPTTVAPPWRIVLLLGRQIRRGHVNATVVTESGRLTPLHQLRLVGPAMHVVNLTTPEQYSEANSQQQPPFFSQPNIADNDAAERLGRLHFGIVGASRTGSLIARALLHLGVRQLTLIDPVDLQKHHMGEVADDLLDPSLLGTNKAEALAKGLAARYPHSRIHAIPYSVTHLRSLNGLKESEFYVSACDHDSARWSLACLAALYARPHLDVATGVPRHSHERIGATIRLVLPSRCLWCVGGLPGQVQALDALRSPGAEQRSRRGQDWRSQRLGSLASLNRIACAIACRAIKDVVTGIGPMSDGQAAVWVQLSFDPSGQLRVNYPPVEAERRRNCPICDHLTCRGDAGLPAIVRINQQLSV